VQVRAYLFNLHLEGRKVIVVNVERTVLQRNEMSNLNKTYICRTWMDIALGHGKGSVGYCHFQKFVFLILLRFTKRFTLFIHFVCLEIEFNKLLQIMLSQHIVIVTY
jgi:hypothetical protein